MEENALKNNVFKKVFIAIPLLFLIELILGGSGNIISIHGIAIRKILFFLAFISLCLYLLIFARNIKIKKIDWFIAIFLVLNIIWMTIVPLLKNSSISMAIDDADTLFVLILYFPTVFLIRQGVFSIGKIKDIFISLTIILAIWHIVMYVLGSFFPGIYLDYFNYFLPTITFGLFKAVTPGFTYVYVRVITTTSIYLIVAFFYVLGEKKGIRQYIYLFILTFAIMTTMTRSLFISAIVGLLIFLIPTYKAFVKKEWLKKLRLVVSVLIIAILINTFIFAPLSDVYIKNYQQKFSINIDQDITSETAASETAVSETAASETAVSENQGETGDVFNRIQSSVSTTEVGNSIRISQIKALLNKWGTSPIIGFGYGSYVEDNIRNEKYLYMYEATIPAMLMKLGIVGILSWILLIIVMIYYAYKNKYKKKRFNEFSTWLIAGIVFALSVQTNPFLFTFCGVSIIAFLCLDVESDIVSIGKI